MFYVTLVLQITSMKVVSIEKQAVQALSLNRSKNQTQTKLFPGKRDIYFYPRLPQ